MSSASHVASPFVADCAAPVYRTWRCCLWLWSGQRGAVQRDLSSFWILLASSKRRSRECALPVMTQPAQHLILAKEGSSRKPCSCKNDWRAFSESKNGEPQALSRVGKHAQ